MTFLIQPLSLFKILEFEFLADCVCVCVCVYVFIFFHRQGFFLLQDVQDILEGTDQRSCVVNIS